MTLEYKTIQVIAHKYNDIIYAISTSEFKKATNRKLIILGDKDAYDKLPFLDLFQDIICLKYEYSTVSILLNLFNIWRLRRYIRCECVFFVTPFLVIDQYIFKISKAKYCVWLEDGMMNYDPMSKESSLLKSSFWASLVKIHVQKALSISDRLFQKHSICTYLLSPAQATWFYGEKKQLLIDTDGVDFSVVSYLNGKKIFVGQNLYPNFCSIEKYCESVNVILNKYSIDYYLPHLYSSNREKINANIIDLSKTKLTLEVISTHFSFSVYSFGSSLLYTTKLINSSVVSYLIKVPFYDVSNFDIINSTVDYVWEFEKKRSE